MQTQPSNNRRESGRAAIELPGVLVFGDEATPCRACDVSEAGARVRTSEEVELPARVHFIDVLAGVAYPAKVTWRAGCELGLLFDCGLDLSEALITNPLRTQWMKHFTGSLSGDDSLQAD